METALEIATDRNTIVRIVWAGLLGSGVTHEILSGEVSGVRRYREVRSRSDEPNEYAIAFVRWVLGFEEDIHSLPEGATIALMLDIARAESLRFVAKVWCKRGTSDFRFPDDEEAVRRVARIGQWPTSLSSTTEFTFDAKEKDPDPGEYHSVSSGLIAHRAWALAWRTDSATIDALKRGPKPFAEALRATQSEEVRAQIYSSLTYSVLPMGVPNHFPKGEDAVPFLEAIATWLYAMDDLWHRLELSELSLISHARLVTAGYRSSASVLGKKFLLLADGVTSSQIIDHWIDGVCESAATAYAEREFFDELTPHCELPTWYLEKLAQQHPVIQRGVYRMFQHKCVRFVNPEKPFEKRIVVTSEQTYVDVTRKQAEEWVRKMTGQEVTSPTE